MDTPMDPNLKLFPNQVELLEDKGRYRRLVGKQNYLTMTWSDIAYPIIVVSQFISAPRTSHWDVVVMILQYMKSAPGREHLYPDCVMTT